MYKRLIFYMYIVRSYNVFTSFDNKNYIVYIIYVSDDVAQILKIQN